MNIWENLKTPFLILAPMEGVTDVIFRQIIAKAGRPDLFFTEFTNVSSYASEKGRENALERLTISDTDSPIIAQIWGREPAHFSEIAKALESLGFSGIDLNFGCPDKHVNKAGGGAAMIKNPELAIECLKNTKKSTNLPVSVKTRLGWSKVEEYKEWLPIILNEHPAALTVHLRTKKEMSKVPAHYELIPEIIKLKNSISPETKLIINGDIRDKAHALELHEKYPEIDGFMIGRGVFSNPYCFTDHTPSRTELIELLKMHLDLYEEYANKPSRIIRDNGSDFRSEPRNDGRERESDEKAYSHTPTYKSISMNDTNNDGPARSGSEKSYSCIPSYEPLKHFFKIYINNFPGAKEIRAKLMETHSVPEARAIINSI